MEAKANKMRILKIFLYLTLSLCLLWGTTVALGPKIITVVLGKFFDEQQLRLTGLAISPKLVVSASHAEFDFSKNGRPFYGTVRAPKIMIYPTRNSWKVQVLSGRLRVNDTIDLLSLKVNFQTNSLTNINAGQFSLTTPGFEVDEDFEFSDVNVTSDVDVSSLELHNVTFSAQTASASDKKNDDNALFKAIAGRLSAFSLRENWQNQLLALDLNVEESRVQSDQFGELIIQLFSLQAKNNGTLIDALLMADGLSMPENGVYFHGIRISPSIDLISLKFQKEVPVQIEHGRFERTQPKRMKGNLKSFDALVGVHLPERFFEVASNVVDLEIWNEQVPFITIPELLLDAKGTISAVDLVQDASASFRAAINGENGPVITGDLASQLSNLENQDCLIPPCVASDVELDFKYEFQGEKMIAKGSCPLGQCSDEKFALVIETSNTSKIIMGLKDQKILNPLALFIFAGRILQGQEVGLGHKVRF